jgi:DnaJ-class molecular chaperone
MRRDFYRILGVDPSSEDIVIRAAYRVLAQRYHPDKRSGKDTCALERMQEINEAYAVLSDQGCRREYDRLHHNSGYDNFRGALAESDGELASASRDLFVSDQRNSARLKEAFLTAEELQRRIRRSGQIIAVL